MCIYCNTTNYRKIYEHHNGPIGTDSNGRTLEVHHIDGDHSNNNPANLTLVTIQGHYDIHYAQGDYGACYLISIQRMDMAPEDISVIAIKNALKRVEEGTHPFLTRADGSSLQQDRVALGKHNFLGSATQLNRLKNNTHPSQTLKTCPHCNKTCSLGQYGRWHGDNCKIITPRKPKATATCQHCNKTVDTANFAKHHGDNCKLFQALDMIY